MDSRNAVLDISFVMVRGCVSIKALYTFKEYAPIYSSYCRGNYVTIFSVEGRRGESLLNLSKF